MGRVQKKYLGLRFGPSSGFCSPPQGLYRDTAVTAPGMYVWGCKCSQQRSKPCRNQEHSTEVVWSVLKSDVQGNKRPAVHFEKENVSPRENCDHINKYIYFSFPVYRLSILCNKWYPYLARQSKNTGWLCFGVSHRLQLLRDALPEGLPGLEKLPSSSLVWQEASFFSPMDLLRGLLAQGSWLTPQRKWTKAWRNQGRSHSVFYELISEVAEYHFCHVLLVAETTLVQCGRDPHGVWIPRDRDHHRCFAS